MRFAIHEESTLRLVREALSLVPARARVKLRSAVLVQGALAVLDLLGIGALGLVVLVGSASLTSDGAALPAPIARFAPGGLELTAQLGLVLAGLAALLLTTKTVISYVVTRRTFQFLARQQAETARNLMALLLSQSRLHLQRYSSQNTAVALTRGINALMLGVLGSSVILISELILVGVLLLALLLVDWVVTVFAAVFFLGVGLLMQRILAKWAGSLGAMSATVEAESLSTVQDAIATYREVAVLGRKQNLVAEFGVQRGKAAGLQADLHLMNVISKYVYELALIFGGGLLAATQLLIMPLPEALAVTALFLATASRLLPSLMRMQQAQLNIRASSGEGALAIEIARWLSSPAEAMRTRGLDTRTAGCVLDKPSPKLVARIEVRNVEFSFEDEKPVLAGISFTVEAGRSLAIVGPSGAGKSTLLDIVLGVLEPSAGQVTIGGLDPRKLPEIAPGYLAYVPQSVGIRNGSVRDNVALALGGAPVPDSSIWRVLEQVDLAVQIQQRGGLDCPIGELGSQWSGGQRQRIGLARALLLEPSVLVLDEATSALDVDSERRITKVLQGLQGEVTQVIVAHRLSTIRDCDAVAYISDGRLIAMGDFKELLASVPDFARQSKLFGSDGYREARSSLGE